MRIRVNSSDTNFRLWLPTRLFLNPIGAAICTKVIKIGLSHSGASVRNHEVIPYSAICQLFKHIRQSRYILDGEPLVSVRSADGDCVDIWI